MQVLGLMSGTSLDGIDAALCEITGSGAALCARLLAFECWPYSEELRLRLLQACANECDVREVARLNVAVGEAFAAAANAVFEKHGRAELIGSHGQTICHLPAEQVTLQIGEGAVIAERTGVTTVYDFRPRDLACGGQGAPLVPYVDWALLRSSTVPRVIQNIGGIANCTVLPANSSLEQVRAWDTGPGNMVIDECARQLFGQQCDQSGHLAAQGNLSAKTRWNPASLAQLHPFFNQLPPKTAGREEFGASFAAQFIDTRQPLEVMAQVTHLTAFSIADSIRQFADLGDSPFEMVVGGGGVHNATLMQMLREELPEATVLTHEDAGLSSDAKEALAFAILAYETMQGVPTNVPAATGANRAAVLGKVVYG